MYETGRGVAKNDAEAMKWYRLSAQQGSVDAQLKLGFLYGLGIGVPKNNVLAYALVNQAIPRIKPAQPENTAVKAFIAGKLTSTQLSLANDISTRLELNQSNFFGNAG